MYFFRYRDAGREIVEVLQEFSNCVQVASIDESYMDITEAVEDRLLQILEQESAMCVENLPSTFAIGYSDDKSNDEGIKKLKTVCFVVLFKFCICFGFIFFICISSFQMRELLELKIGLSTSQTQLV